MRFLIIAWQKISWALWGRRKAVKRLRELALRSENLRQRLTPEKEDERLASHREHLDSIKVSIPTPDSHDVN